MACYLFPDTALLIFCKAPVPGQVKTRLIPDLTAVEAADAHRQLAILTIRTATEQPCCPVQLWCSPNTSDKFFSGMAQDNFLTLHKQQGQDLGARMLHALFSALLAYRHAIIIGTDCPSLTAANLLEACEAIRNYDVVLAPAEDGGYALIAGNRPCPALFSNIPWGTSKVLSITRQRIREQALTCYELATLWDVDTIVDYRRWRNMAGL